MFWVFFTRYCLHVLLKAFITVGLLLLRDLLKIIVAGAEVCTLTLFLPYFWCLSFWNWERIKEQTSLLSNWCLTGKNWFHSLPADLLDNICSFPPLSLQTILGLPSLEEVLQPSQIVPEYVIYNMTHTSKHGVVILQNKSGKFFLFFFF